jgi:hypothetical protein
MPTKQTSQRAKRDLASGKPKQAIAIGLSKARRAGVPLRPPAAGRVTTRTMRAAWRDYEVGQGLQRTDTPSPRRARAAEEAARTKGPRSRSAAATHRRKGR